jgi:molybdopterin synthase catalytic subunit
MQFRITEHPIDVAACRGQIGDDAAGAAAVFEGRVRNQNDGRAVRSLEYEAYTVLAEAEGARILAEAASRFGTVRLYAEHRIGHLQIGDVAVWVGAASPHRREAFDACRYVIDEVKHRVPIWKREHYEDGDAEWVNCARCDSAGEAH